MIFFNYIKVFLKSLVSQKWGTRDFLFIAFIGLLIIRLNSCSPHVPNTAITVPQLAKVEKVIAKDKTVQTVVPQTVFTPSQMKEVTKPIARNLGLDKVTGVTKTVTKIDVDTTVPADVDIVNNTITTEFNTKDIQVKHVLNTDTKQGTFGIHLTPDTTTFVTGIKTHLFKPDEYSVHINHTNSLFNDTLGSSYTEKIPKAWLVIGPSAGVSMTVDNNLKPGFHPMVGVTATFPIITFKKKK